MGVTIWNQKKLRVTVDRDVDGGMTFSGQDLTGVAGTDEYEYWVSVRAEDIPRLIKGLGGSPGADALQLVVDSAALIMGAGEKTFLASIGINPKVSSWYTN